MFTYQPLQEKPPVILTLAALLLVTLLAWLALRPVKPPAPRGPDTPAAAFAATRALPVFRFLSQAPRPIASANNARSRQYLVERLQSLGLDPQVQVASAMHASTGFMADARVHAGVAHNILVRIEGSAPGHTHAPALLLAGHYDSAPDQLGAADASAIVAAMLETLRALQYGAPLANDVIFLFADGDKSGGLGARAFAEQHPWARNVGLVLQFDAAGNQGPLLLTGARGGNGQLVQGWLAKAPLAAGSSALALLARQAPALAGGGPLDTLGAAGMRFANIEASSGYRASFDLPGQVSPATLQHAGDTMLALVRHFGNLPLASIASADQVWFDLPFAGQVHYSADHVWALTRLVCLLLLLSCCFAFKHMDLTSHALVAGAMAYLLLAFALALAAVSLWKGLPGLHESYSPLASGAGARDRWYVLGYVTLGVALFIELQRMLHKAIGSAAATLGALLVLALALVALSWVAPGASYVLAWPLLAALLACGALQVPRVAALPQALRMLLLVAGAAPAVLLVAPLLQQVATLFTAERSALLMLVLAAMLGLATPLLAAARRRFVAPLLLLACAATLVTAAGTRQYQADMAHPNRMTYVNDATSWKAWWVMPAEPLDAWSQPFFADAKFGPRELREVPGMTRADLWVARAPGRKLAYPDIVVLKDDIEGDRRRVVFTLRSQNNAPTIDVRVEGADTLAARLDGQLLTARLARTWKMSLHGTGKRSHTLELELSPDTLARVYIEERIPGLPDGLGGARPAHTPLTETTISSDMLVFR